MGEECDLTAIIMQNFAVVDPKEPAKDRCEKCITAHDQGDWCLQNKAPVCCDRWTHSWSQKCMYDCAGSTTVDFCSGITATNGGATEKVFNDLFAGAWLA